MGFDPNEFDEELVKRMTSPTEMLKQLKAPIKGIKHDDGKPQMDLLSAVAIIELSKVLTFGAKKYASHNWRNGLPYSRVIAAILRHTFAYLNGETNDPETGLSHMAHVLCEAMFLVEFEKTKPELDDRYKENVCL